MIKLLDDCHVDYEDQPESNGWYLFSNQQFKKLCVLDMLPVHDLFEMAKVIADKAGDHDDQLRSFANLVGRESEKNVTILEIEDCEISIAVGEVVFVISPIIKKSKLVDLNARLFLVQMIEMIKVNEVPGYAGFIFLQCFAKYLLGELEDKEWEDPYYGN